MRRGSRQEHTLLAGLICGLLFFPVLQYAGHLFMEEGFITFWIQRSLGIAPPQPVIQAATSTPEAVPAPIRTRTLAIMIDNHPDARPQSGVSKADAVWETLVEGGLTRDMLIFRGAQASEIGPVRSSRPYFQLWASEAGAVYAHFGGSDEALQDLAVGKYGLDNADGMTDGKTFWRDQTRSAPHNAYTSTDRLHALITARGWAEETDAVDSSPRGTAPSGGTPASKAVVTYSSNGTTAEFRWNAATSSYDLWRDGRQARDRDGSAISPPTVVVMEADVAPIADPHAKGLIGIDNLGTGAATILRGGSAFKGTWKKTSAADATKIFGEDGARFPFSAGQVWFSVVGANRGGGVSVVAP